MTTLQNGGKEVFGLRARPDRIVMNEGPHLYTMVLDLIKDTRAKIDMYKDVPIEDRITSRGALSEEIIEENMPRRVLENVSNDSEAVKLLVLEIEMEIFLALADSHNKGEANLEAIREKFVARPEFDGAIFYQTWKKVLERLNTGVANSQMLLNNLSKTI